HRDLHSFPTRRSSDLEKLEKDMRPDTICIAGHARDGQPPTADRKALLRFRDYFDAVLTLTRKAIAQGQSKDALAATAALPGFERSEEHTSELQSPYDL